MGYYIRVLGTSLTTPSLDEIRKAAEPAIIECEDESEDQWQSFLLKHANETPIAVVEKNPVIPGELGADELEEFIEEVAECEPKSGAAWLINFLPSVKVIYAIQFLSGTEIEGGYERLQKVYALIWNKAGGILQADGEGFSNEDGHTAIWQFSDHVTGTWNVGVVSPEGRWTNFEMDLGNPAHREAFRRGEVPDGVNLA